MAKYDGAPATVRRVHVQPLPVRARLAGPDRRRWRDDYAARGVRVLAINSNDADRYPRDSFEAMKDRVAREQWTIPYLHDDTQEVAREYGAKVTPDVFVLDAEGRLRYRGAPDADYDNPARAGGMAARRARRGAGRVDPRAAGDQAGRLLDQVEVVGTAL